MGSSERPAEAARTSATVPCPTSEARVATVGGSILRSPRLASSSAVATGTHAAWADSVVTSSASASAGSAATKNRVS